MAIYGLVAVLAGIFVIPRQGSAVVIDTPNDVEISITTNVKNKEGKYAPENLIRLLRSDINAGNVNTIISNAYNVTIKVNKPATGVELGKDTFDLGAASTDSSGNKTGGMPIKFIGAGMLKQGAGSSAGGAGCKETTLFPLQTENQKYLECPFTLYNEFTNKKLDAGGAGYDLFLNQGGAAFSLYLDLNNTSTPQTLIVYPYVTLKKDRMALVDTQIAYKSAGTSLYVQLFDTQAELDNAIKNNERKGVPAYGGATTGTGEIAPTGSPIVGFINSIISILLSIFTEFLYFLFYWLIAPIIQAMLSIHTYSDTFVNVIYPGWEVVRNISNIFFIVALITIALATLFRLEGYQFRHLLVQIIIAALLVNFSLIICQVILGFAETLQSQFLPNNVEVIRSLARDLMVTNIRNVAWSGDFSSFGTFSNTVQLLFFVSMSIGSFGVFAAIAVFLVVRVVALWIIMMVSPIAYVAGVIPSTAQYRGQWWGIFLKYAFFTPIMAFFLNMTAVINNTMNPQVGVLSVISESSFRDSTSPGLTAFVFKVASNILLLVFLIAALKVSESFSIYGAEAVNKIAQKGMYMPFKLPAAGVKMGAQAGWGMVQRKKTEMSLPLGDSHSWLKKAAFVALNPTKFAKQWKERTESREKVIEHAAAGTAANIVTDLPFHKEPSVDARSENFLHDVQEAEKELPALGEQNNFAQLKDFMHSGKKDINGRRIVWAKIMQMAKNDKSMNFILVKAKELGMDKNYTANGEGLVEFMQDMKDKGWGNEAEIAHIVGTMSNVWYKNGEYNFVEMSKANEHGHPELIEYDKAANGGNGEILGKKVFEENNEQITDEIYIRALAIRAANPTLTPEVALQEAEGEKRQIMETYYNSNPALQAQYGSFDKFSHSYGNYETYISRKEEAQINKNKSENQGFARDVHWSEAADLEPSGRYELGYGSAADIYDRTSGFYSQVNRMQPKKTEAWIKAYSTAQSEIVPSTDTVKNKYGVDSNNAEIKVADRAYSKIIDKAKSTGVVIDPGFKADARRLAIAAAKQRMEAFERFVISGEKYSNGAETDIPSGKADAFADLQREFNTFASSHNQVFSGQDVYKSFALSKE